MRALADFYFTAHPRSCTTCTRRNRLYTLAAALRRIQTSILLFTELPFFANFELAQMTKGGCQRLNAPFMEGGSLAIWFGGLQHTTHDAEVRKAAGTDQTGTVTTSQEPWGNDHTGVRHRHAQTPAQHRTRVRCSPAAAGSAAPTQAPLLRQLRSSAGHGCASKGSRTGRGPGRGDAVPADGGRGGRSGGRQARAAATQQSSGAGRRRGRALYPAVAAEPREWYRAFHPAGAVQNFSRAKHKLHADGVLSDAATR